MGVAGVPTARNIVEWAPDQTRRIRVERYEPNLVPMQVTSATTQQPITINVMRLYLSEVDGVKGSFEWNVAAKGAMAQLNEILKRGDFHTLLLEVTRQGQAPTTKWAIRIVT